VFALCSATSDAVVEETTFRVPEGSTRHDAARCPIGRRVTGGGIGASATPVNDYVQVSGPLDETGSTSNTVQGDVAQYWYAAVYNYSLAGPEAFGRPGRRPQAWWRAWLRLRQG
jgi:hypothetical protein